MKITHNISIIEVGYLLKMFLLCLFFGLISSVLSAQDNKGKLQELKDSQEFLSDASLALQEDEFPIAEADFRKAIALNPANETGKYNLGTAYYGKSKNTEALNRFKQAASVAIAKPDKHRAFHNLGNTLMNEKNYGEAVEAYKNALRNNPIDDESRYNLALAKDMLEKNPPQDDESDDENKDKDDKKEDDSENKEGDDGDQKEDQDKGDEKEDKKDGEDEKDKGKPDEPKDQDKKPQEQQPKPGQLSPQQVKSLLDAMNNEEEKVQEKVNAQKQKGAKVKSNKDW
ncbi:MAG: Ca-activated chloride channel family protein [Sediminicola sp.]|jgi:tetratricopeptide (TPR) repeat protein|tara:strand:- start:5218 stop:6072 length:855 start_codon:yes stop_codon:yes gene_type:complete